MTKQDEHHYLQVPRVDRDAICGVNLHRGFHGSNTAANVTCPDCLEWLAKQEAIKRSAQHWYSNWALLSGKPEGTSIRHARDSSLFRIGDYAHFRIGPIECALCGLYFHVNCEGCPITCLGPNTPYTMLERAAENKDLPAMITAARALYEKLNSLVEE